jgi:aspartyl/asparaginyl beta-hydroxylase (cupin superfamily)
MPDCISNCYEQEDKDLHCFMNKTSSSRSMLNYKFWQQSAEWRMQAQLEC